MNIYLLRTALCASFFLAACGTSDNATPNQDSNTSAVADASNGATDRDTTSVVDDVELLDTEPRFDASLDTEETSDTEDTTPNTDLPISEDLPPDIVLEDVQDDLPNDIESPLDTDTEPDDVAQNDVQDDTSAEDVSSADTHEEDLSPDTAPEDVVEDVAEPELVLLTLGDTIEGEVTAESGVDYRIDLQTGDIFRFVLTTLEGDLQPSAFLHPEVGSFIEPTSFNVGEQRVTLNYTMESGGAYTVRVRAYNGVGTGRFQLESTCIAGPCLDALNDPNLVRLRLIAINDFHGHLDPPSENGGGAAWLMSHVKRLRAQATHAMFISAGDLLGASPYLSARFHDEPTIEVMNYSGLDINAVGNHEFDEGLAELQRLQQGGCHPVDGCGEMDPFPGATFQTLGANVVDRDSGEPVFPEFAVRFFDGIPVAFIGMTLEGTRSVTVPSQVADLEFEDEVETVNRLLPELREMGIEAIVVVLHQGGVQDGSANDCNALSGRIVAIAEAMDDAVDVILSGHTHDTYVCTIDGKSVTSAGNSGRWITRLELILERDTGDVQRIEAANLYVDHTLAPDPIAEAVIARYRIIVEAEVNAVVGTLAEPLTGTVEGDYGLSTLGLAIADSQLLATQESAGAQVAFMNRGGIRASLNAGDVTFGDVFATQPFENRLYTVTLSGTQLEALLRNQFAGSRFSVLQPSDTLRYRIETVEGDVRLREGSVRIDGVALDPNAEYRVTANQFLAEGGDGNPVFAEGTDRDEGEVDSQAFVDYLRNSPSPLPAPALDRISD